MKRKQLIPFLLTLALLLLSVSTSFAKKAPPAPPPTVTVVSRWTPQEQLVSVPSDTRTVNLQMSARSDRQFWAMDISCLVSLTNVFESTGQTMTWAGGWSEGTGTTYNDITLINSSYFDDITNRINATITRVGASNAPMGLNGTSYTEFLFDLKLTVKQGLIGTNIISISCDKLTFLDRNGVSLGIAVLDSTNNLVIRDGYALSGSVVRQGTANKNEILVSCTHDGTGDTSTTTTANDSGFFSFSNDANTPSAPLRNFGLYTCEFTSNIGGTPDEPFLIGKSLINLQTPTLHLQPISLRAGDTTLSNGITIADFPAITGNWLGTPPAFTSGDVNGDSLVNETDLALAAGNIGLPQADCDGDVCQQLDHVIYSAARDYKGTFPNNSLLAGDIISGNVSPLSSDRLFWPQVSPNGSQIAYYGSSTKYYDKKGKPLPDANKAAQTVIEEGILVGNTTDFSGSLIAGGLNFAPSWSPSGNKIAYICSWDDTGDVDLPGYQLNNGNLCVVNASGGSVQTLIPSGARSSYAGIFPPAWYNETTLIYAGNEQSEICPDQLCYYDMLTGVHGLIDFDYDVNGTSVFADMPLINRQSETLSYLFYRRFTSGSSRLQMGTIEYSGGVWSGGVVDSPVGTATLHQEIPNSSPVDYYDVSPMRDVMFYGFGDTQFHNLYFVDGSPFSWTVGEDHIVDGFIGYPTTSEFFTVWDGDEYNATDFHAFRATFDWIP